MIWKRNSIRQNSTKRNLLQAHEDEDNSLQYQFQKYNENKDSADINGYLAYKKLKHLNTKIRNLSHKLKDIYSITVGTNNPQCSEPSDPIIECANCNRITIQIFTSIYQIKPCNVSSPLIISRRTFTFTKGSRYSDPI